MYTESRLPHGATLWRSAGSPGGAMISADGCVDLILREERVWIAGPSTRRIITAGDGEGGSTGLRLPPGRAGHLLGLGLSEIADQVLPLDALIPGERARKVHGALLLAAHGEERPDALSALAAAAAQAGTWSNAVRHGAAQSLSAATMASECGSSERTFRRRMLTTFGYGYATLQRLERLRQAQELLGRGASLSAAAAGAGFADQPHLSREFRRLAGMSPGQFVASSA